MKIPRTLHRDEIKNYPVGTFLIRFLMLNYEFYNDDDGGRVERQVMRMKSRYTTLLKLAMSLENHPLLKEHDDLKQMFDELMREVM